MTESHFVFAAKLGAVRDAGCVTAQVDGHTLALFHYGERVYAVDNRCPHMGFPLRDGSVKDGILTCHWHHARFDLASGGAFDLFADDVRAFPTEMRADEIWVDVAAQGDMTTHQAQRVRDGLERNLPLVIAKAVIGMTPLAKTASGSGGEMRAFQIGLDFGTRFRQRGWGQGLTMLTCMMNLLPHLAPEDRSRALYHGLGAVADDTENMAPRFVVQPLPATSAATDITTLKRWFRQFVEVRDSEGAERCVVSAIRMGASRCDLADMLFAAATDHRYITTGHPLDFTNKALEALDWVGWEGGLTEQVLTSLVSGYANASRMEESNAWRNPIDLVAILEGAFQALSHVQARKQAHEERQIDAASRAHLIELLLGDDPQATVKALMDALEEGTSAVALAGTVAYACALRIARFHISNEFGDWDTALHTFTFANAVHQGLRRLSGDLEVGAPAKAAPTPAWPDLVRGIFDAAMSLYLDRFLNVPPARIPVPNGQPTGPLDELLPLLDRQQQVDAAAEVVAKHAYHAADASPLLATLGKLLLREDRNFHTIQSLEASVRQHALIKDHEPEAAARMLIAASRYLAAHSPTMRAQGQTFNIAVRLGRGEKLFEE